MGTQFHLVSFKVPGDPPQVAADFQELLYVIVGEARSPVKEAWGVLPCTAIPTLAVSHP